MKAKHPAGRVGSIELPGGSGPEEPSIIGRRKATAGWGKGPRTERRGLRSGWKGLAVSFLGRLRSIRLGVPQEEPQPERPPQEVLSCSNHARDDRSPHHEN